MKALGGKFGLAYIGADVGVNAFDATLYTNGARKVAGAAGSYTEIDASYKAKVTEDITVFAAYVYQEDDRYVESTQNFVRFWARYNF